MENSATLLESSCYVPFGTVGATLTARRGDTVNTVECCWLPGTRPTGRFLFRDLVCTSEGTIFGIQDGVPTALGHSRFVYMTEFGVTLALMKHKIVKIRIPVWI